MKLSPTSLSCIEKAIKTAIGNYSDCSGQTIVTDIHLQANQAAGELTIFDDEDKETVAELLLIDDNTLLLNDELLKGLDEELDAFLKDLLK